MRYYVGKDTTQRERQKHPPWKDSGSLQKNVLYVKSGLEFSRERE